MPCRSSTCAQLVRHHADHFALACAASNMPRWTNIGPPGSAKALISFKFTGVNEYLNAGLLSSRWRDATRLSPSFVEIPGNGFVAR